MRTACGSRLYAAPEVIQHKSYEASVDMWGLGVVMYVLLSGDVPFIRLRDIIQAKVEFKGAIWNFVSEEAKDLITGLIQKDPKSRLTPEKVLEHKWVKGAAPSHPLPDLSVLLHSFEKTHGQSLSPPIPTPTFCFNPPTLLKAFPLFLLKEFVLTLLFLLY
jgi:serine/threonine protein kinase